MNSRTGTIPDKSVLQFGVNLDDKEGRRRVNMYVIMAGFASDAQIVWMSQSVE